MCERAMSTYAKNCEIKRTSPRKPKAAANRHFRALGVAARSVQDKTSNSAGDKAPGSSIDGVVASDDLPSGITASAGRGFRTSPSDSKGRSGAVTSTVGLSRPSSSGVGGVAMDSSDADAGGMCRVGEGDIDRVDAFDGRGEGGCFMGETDRSSMNRERDGPGLSGDTSRDCGSFRWLAMSKAFRSSCASNFAGISAHICSALIEPHSMIFWRNHSSETGFVM